MPAETVTTVLIKTLRAHGHGNPLSGRVKTHAHTHARIKASSVHGYTSYGFAFLRKTYRVDVEGAQVLTHVLCERTFAGGERDCDEELFIPVHNNNLRQASAWGARFALT